MRIAVDLTDEPDDDEGPRIDLSCGPDDVTISLGDVAITLTLDQFGRLHDRLHAWWTVPPGVADE